MDTYRAEYLGRNLGPVSTLLPQFRIRDAAKAKRFLADDPQPEEMEEYTTIEAEVDYLSGLALLHDNNFHAAWIPILAPVRRHFRILDEMDYARIPYRFMPYWNQDITSKRREDDAVASFYVAPGRAVMVTMNMQNEQRDLQWDIDFSRLGLKHFTARILHGPNTFSLDGNTLTLPDVGPYQHCVIEWIEDK